VAAHEDELAAWKQRFCAEALRQIGERERALSEWQARLEAQRGELASARADMEARAPPPGEGGSPYGIGLGLGLMGA